MTATGSLAMTGLNLLFSNSWGVGDSNVQSGTGNVIRTAIGTTGNAYDLYSLPAFTSASGNSIGNVGQTTFDTVNAGSTISGFVFSLTTSSVFVPGGYTSGGTINATGTFTGKTIAGMGLIHGTYTWAWGGVAPDSVTITVVPEPGAASLAVAFAATVGLLWRTRRRRQAANG